MYNVDKKFNFKEKISLVKVVKLLFLKNMFASWATENAFQE